MFSTWNFPCRAAWSEVGGRRTNPPFGGVSHRFSRRRFVQLCRKCPKCVRLLPRYQRGNQQMSARLPPMRMRPFSRVQGVVSRRTHMPTRRACLCFPCCLPRLPLGSVMTWVTGKVCFRQALVRFCASLAERRITWAILPGLGCKQRQDAPTGFRLQRLRVVFHDRFREPGAGNKPEFGFGSVDARG